MFASRMGRDRGIRSVQALLAGSTVGQGISKEIEGLSKGLRIDQQDFQGRSALCHAVEVWECFMKIIIIVVVIIIYFLK
jgi:hypothetical protein